jgi:two-component system sensor histidine kinase KdpD
VGQAFSLPDLALDAFGDNQIQVAPVHNLKTGRPDPDQLLRQVQAEEECARRGRLKVFLGYASGVGKSLRMFDEGRRRRERGQDVVVGAVQEKISPELEVLLSKLETIPLLQANGFRVMDVEAIKRRRPAVCLVDGLAYDNPPGWRTSARWQDVEELLCAGINVIASVNLQFIEGRRDRVEAITGKHVTQTVPESFLRTADDIEVVDAPPEACAHSGDDPDRDAAATRQRQLSELREIALLLAADIVDRQLERYIERNGIEQQWGVQERILVCITPRASAARMIESGRRNVERFHGELLVAHVAHSHPSPQDREGLARNFELARAAGANVETLDGEDFVETVLRFAHERGVTQIFVGHSPNGSLWSSLFGSPVDRLIRKADGIDVRVFPQ